MWKQALQRVLSHVIVHVTDRCDLACDTCFVRKGRRDLTLESARVMASKLGKITWLDIGGGEPFLAPDLVAICRAFDTRVLTVPTNGQRTAAIVETVRRLRDEWSGELTIALSLDGFEPDNDAVRGAGTFQKAVATFEALHNVSSLIVKINTVVCEATFERLVPFMEYVRRELAPDYHSLLLLRGQPASEGCVLPPLDALVERTPAILDILQSYTYADRNPVRRRLKRNYQQFAWHTWLKTIGERKCFVPCKAPYLHKVIYPDGSVSMCELMPPIGNILEEPVEVLDRKMREALAAYEAANGPCFCTHNCNMGENILTDPASMARIIVGKTHG